MGYEINVRKMITIEQEITALMNKHDLTHVEKCLVLQACKDKTSIEVIETYLEKRGAVCLKR